MKGLCFLGKSLVALGISLVLLSMGAFVDQANAACNNCGATVTAMRLVPSPAAICGRVTIAGGIVSSTANATLT
jgi:hypothetical protein